MDWNGTLTRVKNGDFQNMEEPKIEFNPKSIKSSKDLEQIVLAFYHYLYNNKEIPESAVLYISDAIHQCLSSESAVNYKDNELTFTYFIGNIVYLIWNGLPAENISTLVEEVDFLLSKNVGFCSENPAKIKPLYSALWNKGLSSKNFELQYYSLCLMFFTQDGLQQALEKFYVLGKTFLGDSLNCEEFYEKALNRLTESLVNVDTLENECSVLILKILVNYLEVISHTDCKEYASNIFKKVSASLKEILSQKMYRLMNLIFTAIDDFLNIKKANDKIFAKSLEPIIKTITITTNYSVNNDLCFIILKCFLLFSVSDDKLPTVRNILVENFLPMVQKISVSSNFISDIFIMLSKYVAVLQNEISKNKNSEALCTEVVKVSLILKDMLPAHQNPKLTLCIHNIGVYLGNISVVLKSVNNYPVICKILPVCITYLNCTKDSKFKSSGEKNVGENLAKRCVMMLEVLRYSNKFLEAVDKALEYSAKHLITDSDLITCWVKCKKDALNYGLDSFQDMTIKDAYQKFMEKKDREIFCLDLNINELLVEELVQVKKLINNNNRQDRNEEKACGLALKSSKSLQYSLIGYLTLVEISLTTQTLFDNKKPLELVKFVMRMLDKSQKIVNEHYLELSASASFWYHLCQLQFFETIAEHELEKKKNQNFDNLNEKNVPLGEEVSSNDSCLDRTDTSITNFPIQKVLIKELHKSLEFYDKLIKTKGSKIIQPEVVCENLLAMSYIFKLRGITQPAVKALTLLIIFAQNNNFDKYFIQGHSGLFELVPELIPPKIAEMFALHLNKKTDEEILTDAFIVESKCSLAFYHYRNSEFISSANLILECFSSPVFKKKTAHSIMSQVYVYHVSSLLYLLPDVVLPAALKAQNLTCLDSALIAVKQSLSVLTQFKGYNNDNVCVQHNLAYLYVRSSLHLGNVCYLLANHRRSRANFKQTLNLCQKIVLPLRVCEVLCGLAEIDLLLGQLDDCRVKVDTLNSTLRNLHSKSDFESIKATYEMEISTPPVKISANKSVVKASAFAILSDFNDKNERLRRDSSCDIFNSSHIVIPETHLPNEKRIAALASVDFENLGCVSPTMVAREKGFVVSSLACSKKFVGCDSCSSFKLHSVAIRTQIIMGLIHAYRSDPKTAQKCFKIAERDTSSSEKLSSGIKENFDAIFSDYSVCLRHPSLKLDHEFINLNKWRYWKNNLVSTKLHLIFSSMTMECLNGGDVEHWEFLEEKSTENLATINSLDKDVIAILNLSILEIIFLADKVRKNVQKLKTKPLPIMNDSAQLVEDLSLSRPDFDSFKTPMKTAVKPRPKAGLGRQKPSIMGKKLPVTPFKIFEDTPRPKTVISKVYSKPQAKGAAEKKLKNSEKEAKSNNKAKNTTLATNNESVITDFNDNGIIRELGNKTRNSKSGRIIDTERKNSDNTNITKTMYSKPKISDSDNTLDHKRKSNDINSTKNIYSKPKNSDKANSTKNIDSKPKNSDNNKNINSKPKNSDTKKNMGDKINETIDLTQDEPKRLTRQNKKRILKE